MSSPCDWMCAQASCLSLGTNPSLAMAVSIAVRASVATWCPNPREPLHQQICVHARNIDKIYDFEAVVSQCLNIPVDHDTYLANLVNSHSRSSMRIQNLIHDLRPIIIKSLSIPQKTTVTAFTACACALEYNSSSNNWQFGSLCTWISQ
jgi:hypothetical protein